MADFNTQIEHRVDIASIEEKQVSALLSLEGMEAGFFVKKIQENVFAVGWDNTEYFCDKQGNVLVSSYWLRRNTTSEKLKEESKRLFQAVAWQAGYREEKDPKTGVYALYNLQSGENKVVPINTPEYFQAWKDIEFFYQRWQIVVIWEDGPKTEDDRVKVVRVIKGIAKNGNIAIKDILFLASQKPLYLTKEDFEAILPFARDHLLEQIGDMRWDRVLSPKKDDNGSYAVNKEELDQYLSLKLIERPLYDKAIGKLADMEELKRKKSKQSQAVIESTKENASKIHP